MTSSPRARIPDAGFHPDARRESHEAGDLYDVRCLGLGSESLDEIARTTRQVVEYQKERFSKWLRQFGHVQSAL